MSKLWLAPPLVEPQPDLLNWLRQTYGAEDASKGSLPTRGLEIVAQTLQRRGFSHIEQAQSFLDPEAYQPASPYELPGMKTAVERLLQAIRQQEVVLVWGDFDVDGQTATSLLVSALRQLGGRVRYHIPVRAYESHGVSVPVLSRLLADHGQGRIRLVLTCDTGIAAVEAIEYANQQGVEVLVTDHHELPPALPAALALVNPNFLPEEHALHSLPGVGVAYKLVEALFEAAGGNLQAEQFLDLAALGCVADVAVLRGETRYLVQRGLPALAERKRLGLRLLLEAANVPLGPIDEQVIGFTLAPRLNSLGRLDDANPVVDFLIEEEEGLARVFVARLEALNARRQLLTSQTLQGALAQLEREPHLLDDPVLVLSHPAWPAGVIGIVANRLVEQFGKPTILFAAPPDEPARGSARSVEGFDITAALRWVQEKSSDGVTPDETPLALGEERPSGEIFYGFGGHSMAAGMSLPAERIDELRLLLRQAAQQQELQPPMLQIDAFVDFSELDFVIARQLELMAPFGSGNPPLVLASQGLQVVRTTRIGRGNEHLKLVLRDAKGLEKEVLWWQSADLAAGLDLTSRPVDLAFKLSTSTFRGQPQLQLTWEDFRPTALPEISELLPTRQAFDLRNVSQPLAALASILRENPAALVLAEAEARSVLRKQHPQANLTDRGQLTLNPILAIWTPPHSRGELVKALHQVQPKKVYLFNQKPAASSLNSFLERLAGLVKYALSKKDGQVELESLAVATGQSLLAVRMGLDWLVASGHILITDDQGEVLKLSPAHGKQTTSDMDLSAIQTKAADPAAGKQVASPEKLAAQIAVLLEEAAAFRGYYGRAEPDSLIA